MEKRHMRPWRADPAREIADELEFHLEMRMQELVESGMDEEQARREAQRAFGDRAGIERELYGIGRRRVARARRMSYVDELRTDVHHAWRSFVRRPGVPLIVVITLALSIGAGTAVFSLFDAVVLNPIAVARADELVKLSDGAAGEATGLPFSYPMLRVLRERGTLVRGIAGKTEMSVGFRAGTHAEQLSAALVTGNYFALLGVGAQRGRLLQPADEAAPGTTPYAVISDALWRRLFGSDDAVLGRTVSVNEATFTIVGVAAPRFRGTELAAPVDVWLPITMVREIGGGGLFSATNVLDTWFFGFIEVFARLPSGASLERALTELRTIHGVAQRDVPEREGPVLADSESTTILAVPFNEAAAWRSRADLLRFLAVLAGVVAISLAIACVNVANLMLIRATNRVRELSIRAAAGASRARLVRQLLAETAALGAISGAAAVGVALLSMRLLAAFSLPGGIALTNVTLPLDRRVLGFSIAVSLVCTLAFGLAPALLGARTDVLQALRHAAGDGRRGRLRGGGPLITVQVALSLLLLVTGFLFVRSLQSALRVDLGFDARGVASVAVGLRQHGYHATRLESFVDAALAELRARPGIVAAAAATRVPVDHDALRLPLTPAGGGRKPRLPLVPMTPGYLDLLGIPLVAGRDFTAADRAGAPRVAIVSERAARELWPGENPLGKQFVAMFGAPYTVIGVAADAHFTRLDVREPQVFLSLGQVPELGPMERLRFVARGSDGAMVKPTLRAALRRVDPRLPTFQERDVEQQIAAVLMTQRFGTLLLTVFGSLSLLIAGVGVYAVTSYDVARRRRELGIRAALGAQRADLVHAVLRRSGAAVCAGVVLGLLVAAVVTQSVRGLLFGIDTYEPVSYLLAAVVLGAIATLAASLPARRAARIDPMRVIRE